LAFYVQIDELRQAVQRRQQRAMNISKRRYMPVNEIRNVMSFT
jgi:hypothetical protein